MTTALRYGKIHCPEVLNVFKENIAKEDNDALYGMMARVDACLEKYEASGYVMTDDQAPVEFLGMQVIDDLIADEVSYYKQIYKEQGLSGLMDEFDL